MGSTVFFLGLAQTMRTGGGGEIGALGARPLALPRNTKPGDEAPSRQVLGVFWRVVGLGGINGFARQPVSNPWWNST